MRERRTELAVAGVVFATVFLIEIGSAITPELWWQLVSGDVILSDGFPITDPISWTQADRPWTIHGWLSHVLLAGLAAWLGIESLLVVFTTLLALAWTSVFVGAPGNPFGRAVFCLVGAAAVAPLTSADSRTVSLVLLAVTVSIVELVARGRWPRLSAWAIAPLWVLWANLDTWFLIGVGYVALRAVGVRIARDREDALTDRIGAVIGAGAAGLVGTIVNPAGFEIWPAAWHRLTEGPRSLVGNLQSPDFQLQHAWPWILLVGLVVLAMAFSKPRPLSELLVFFGLLIPAMISYEYVAVHAIAAVPIGAAVVAVGRNDRAPVPAIWAVAVTVALLAGFNARGPLDDWAAEQPEVYPVAAVDYLEDADLALESVFNEVFWGGYLASRDIAAFVDTRYDFHDEEFLVESINAVNALPAWSDLEPRWQPDAVIIRSDRPLARLLEESPDWSIARADGVAVVFIRGGR